MDNPQQQPRPDSGFVHLVCHDEKEDLSEQLQPAFSFLLHYEEEIKRAGIFGADNFLLDFGLAPPPTLQTSVYLPPELIEIMGRFKMGLAFSVVQLGRG